MGLNKIIVLYDSNHITIEGDTATAFAEDVLKRFEAYGWDTQEVADGKFEGTGLGMSITKAFVE